jgi:hypothetical protein
VIVSEGIRIVLPPAVVRHRSCDPSFIDHYFFSSRAYTTSHRWSSHALYDSISRFFLVCVVAAGHPTKNRLPTAATFNY